MSHTTVTNYLFKLDHSDSGFYFRGKPGAAEGLFLGALVDTQPEFPLFGQCREALSSDWGLPVSAQEAPRSAWSSPWLTMDLMKICTHQTLIADGCKYVLQVYDTLRLDKVGTPWGCIDSHRGEMFLQLWWAPVFLPEKSQRTEGPGGPQSKGLQGVGHD